MSDIKEFKQIADEAMRDIKVSEELKERTRARLGKKERVPVGRILIPAAACLVLVVGLLQFSGLPKSLLQTNRSSDKSAEVQMNGASVKSGEAHLDGAPADVSFGSKVEGEYSGNKAENQQNSKIVTTSDRVASQFTSGYTKAATWEYKTLEEAREHFGKPFLTPAVIPQGYALHQIHASGANPEEITQVVLNYVDGDRTYMIIEEKSVEQPAYEGFEKVKINEAEAYLKSGNPQSAGDTATQDIELNWFREGNHYSIIGLITKEDAIRVAASMK